MVTLFFRRAAAPAVLAAAMLAGTPPALAGDAGSHAKWIRVAGLFGESDEEKAARLAAEQREQAQDAAIASLTQRVSDLERSLRDVTGQIEEAGHQNVLLKEQIARMKKDFDYRICQLSAQVLAASPGGDTGPGVDCSAYGGTPTSAQPGATTPPAAGANAGSGMGQPSGTLGTLPSGTPVPQQQSSMGQAAAASASANSHEFQAAMGLLTQGRYSEAGAAFRAFADAHPDDPQTPQAVYWVGSVAFVQKDYAGAARAFAEEIKKYPDAELAPQSMLRLGQSLIAMKQKDEGCTTLAALRSKYPKASASVRREAEQTRHDDCR